MFLRPVTQMCFFACFQLDQVGLLSVPIRVIMTCVLAWSFLAPGESVTFFYCARVLTQYVLLLFAGRVLLLTGYPVTSAAPGSTAAARNCIIV